MNRPDLDPDPLGADWIAANDAQHQAYELGLRHGRNEHRRGAGRSVAILVAFAFGVGLFVGVRIAAAAPRSAQTTERVDLSAPSSAGPTGAPPPQVGDRHPGRGAVSPSPARTDQPSTPAPFSVRISSGVASWCAPTPTHCRRWAPPALLGAVPSFRFGDRPYVVRVRAGHRHVDVTVVSFCACGGRLIDLSPAAFRRLAPLSRGIVHVTVQRVEETGPVPTPPATDATP